MLQSSIQLNPTANITSLKDTHGVSVNPASSDLQTSANALAQAFYDAIVRLQPYQNAVPYARDISDQMRVNVAQGSLTVNGLTWANNGSYATYYAQGGPNSVDTREQLEEAANLNFNYIRTQRWVIT